MELDTSYKLLQDINSPEDLRKLQTERLPEVCQELRQKIIDELSCNPGHFGSSLGVIELTVALHYTFNTPYDRIVWDVGHQAYGHKILTGRRDTFHTNRKLNGIRPFPSPKESEYDTFTCGHASNSISAALGMAVAAKHKGEEKRHVVAVIGDGAFTGGMIHEALNNCKKDLKLVIILNENEMSISKNIGRFATSLSKLRASAGYFKTKRATGIFLRKIPFVGNALFEGVKKLKMMLKNALYGSNYFESMGLTYLGPVDGNDYNAVVTVYLTKNKKMEDY